MVDTMLSAGTVIAERFRLERPLGEGGMGAVWVARHLALQIPCALKFIRGEAAGSADLRARFEREARSAAQLRSPHVVQILDHGVWHDVPYIAMELLEGEELNVRLDRLGRLQPRETLSIISQVARALTKAHAAGLVHRDLKPANIFLARDDDREIAKVLDFGIAKSNALESAEGHTKSGSLIGTPGYMSPEQARGLKGIDHRANVWALGVIAYQCLTGRCPFEREALGELLMLIITHTAPKPSEVAQVPPGLDAWWARAIAQKKADRFQSAKELAEALAVALGLSADGAGEIGHSVAPPGAPVEAPANPGMALTEAVKALTAAPAATVSLGWGYAPAAMPAQTGGGVSTPVAAPPPAPPAKRSTWPLFVGAATVVALGAAAAFFAFGGPRPREAAAPVPAVAEPRPVVPPAAVRPAPAATSVPGATAAAPSASAAASASASTAPFPSSVSVTPVVPPTGAPSTQASQVAPAPPAASHAPGALHKGPPLGGPRPPKSTAQDGDYGI